MNSPIYLDYAATTPVDPRVAPLMMRCLTIEGQFGNPASLSHSFGFAAKTAVEHARAQVADLIHAEVEEIIWTSGATEAINLALKGAAQLYQRKGKHIITMKTEHKAVLDTCQQLEKEGFLVTYLSPQADGSLSLLELENALRPDTILVAIMHVNNETGVIQDIDAIARLTAQREILLMVDAAQSGGKLPIDVSKTPVDLMAFSGHKIYGPKGIGALYVRRKPRVRLAPQIHGGGQEQGMRSGTLPTHQIVGIGEAFHLAKNEMSADDKKLRALRKLFWERLSVLPNVSVNGSLDQGYPGILNICFGGHTAKDLIQALPDLAISAGSACLSKGVEPSYVLRAMGLSKVEAESAVRISFGRFTTQADIKSAASQIISAVSHSREGGNPL